MKRKFIVIDNDFVNDCDKEFKGNEVNKIIKNVITNVGSFHASCDHEESTKVSHVFLNSIKRKNIKATNQGVSGRCWLFAGLNMFRHSVINGLDLENFEFSETFLFFWDKFERSNTFLNYIDEIVNKETELDTNNVMYKYFMDEENWMSDGGYWTFFANLVSKYGLIPKTAMPETFQSEQSHDMNINIMNILQSTSANLKNISLKDSAKRNKIKEATLKQIYNILVKYLGEPPKKFKWEFTNDSGVSNCIENLTPFGFKDLVLPSVDINDFVLLTNIPNSKFPFYRKYVINKTNNVFDKNLCESINLPIYELKKCARKSILAGMPVWFAGDVNKGFNPLYSTLNQKLNNEEILFGKTYKMSKEERFVFLNQKTNHAMTLVGLNIDSKSKSSQWQVENSWGFYDNEIPGLDGFLCMSDEWFDEYLGQIVVHKNFLSRKLQKILDSEGIVVEAWDSLSPALKIN